jgi:hypothetical protein
MQPHIMQCNYKDDTRQSELASCFMPFENCVLFQFNFTVIKKVACDRELSNQVFFKLRTKICRCKRGWTNLTVASIEQHR